MGNHLHAAKPALSKLTKKQVHDYAQALSEIMILKHAAAEKSKNMSSDERLRMRLQLDAQVAQTLARYDLNRPEFNQISSAVERDSGLRSRVRQLMMEEIVGI